MIIYYKRRGTLKNLYIYYTSYIYINFYMYVYIRGVIERKKRIKHNELISLRSINIGLYE
jgi:hypothetical protein|nr:MAG TPA: hypothetical protein [Caudoviricetes sp.]